MKSIYSKVGRGLRVTVAAAGLALLLGGTAQAGDDTFKIARDKSIPGKYGIGTCDVFAKDLYSKITQAGGEAHYIVYDWEHVGGGTGRHAIVVYRDSHGRYFGMDQSHRMPIWLSGHTPGAWVAWFNGPGYTKVVRTVTDESLSGEYADLSRPPRNIGKTNEMLAMQ